MVKSAWGLIPDVLLGLVWERNVVCLRQYSRVRITLVHGHLRPAGGSAGQLMAGRRCYRALMWAAAGVALLTGCSAAGESSSPDQLSTSVETAAGPVATGSGLEGLRGSRHVPSWEWAQVMHDCLTGKGWQVEIPEDDPGAIEHHVPADQPRAYTQDLVDCSNEHDFSPDPPTIDAASADRAWEEYTRAASCMSDHGYDPPEPPSKERFVAEQLAGGSSWNPHRVPAGDEPIARAAITACPISNDYVLFGVRHPDR